MGEFVNPFSGVTPGRKLTDRELSRAIRLSLSAEQEAIHLYEALADSTDNQLAKEVLQDVANEERVHAGEFLRLLKILLPDEQALLDEGAGEVDEEAEKLGQTSGSGEQASEEAGSDIPTVGDLKD